MTNLDDSVKRLTAYSAMYAEAKVDGIGPKGGIKRVPAPDRISGLSDGSTLLYTDLKTVLAAVEQFDTILVKALTLPVLGDVEDELVKAVRDTHGSINDGVQAVYGEVLEMLALNLVLARAALAGDDPDEQLPVEGVWPPRAGDVWKDRDGDLWFATDMNAADDPGGPCIEFVSTRLGDHEDPDEARRLWGPIGLMYRAQPEVAAGSWPPQEGDVWQDSGADNWEAVARNGEVRLRLHEGAALRPAEYVRDNYGPLKLVQR